MPDSRHRHHQEISLFLTHGFDQISVTDIAAAAEVPKPTLTNWQKIADGRTARDVHPEDVADADLAYDQLRALARAHGWVLKHRGVLCEVKRSHSGPASFPRA